MKPVPVDKLQTRFQKWAPIFTFLALLIVFSLIYSQSPLFTSNQNQYFLHGLARAGFGDLDEDWLANTTEPTPVFSWIVQTSYHLFRTNAVFYLYYALLLGIYIYSLLQIVFYIFDTSNSRTLYLLYTSSLLFIHSAAFRFFNSRIFGSNWTYILEDGVADQRLLGPVFQPSAFGILFLVSILLFLKNKPYWSIFSAVLAAIIHPTYLLAAGSLVLSYMLVTLKEDRSYWRTASYGLFGLIMVLPIVTYIYLNFTSAPPETLNRAQEILINFRIPHHASIASWLDSTAIVKILLIFTGLYLVRNNRIFLILLVPMLVSASLTALQFILDSNTLALIFPWRISTLMVPLCSAIILAKLISVFYQRYPELFQRHQKSIEILSATLIILLMAAGLIRIMIEFNIKSSLPEREMMEFVSQNYEPGEIYFVPKKMQDFRLATGVPVYGDFKSIPYNPEDVLEWRRRIKIIEEFYRKPDCESFNILIDSEDLDSFVVPTSSSMPACERVSPVYKDDHYWIYAAVNAQ